MSGNDECIGFEFALSLSYLLSRAWHETSNGVKGSRCVSRNFFPLNLYWIYFSEVGIPACYNTSVFSSLEKTKHKTFPANVSIKCLRDKELDRWGIKTKLSAGKDKECEACPCLELTRFPKKLSLGWKTPHNVPDLSTMRNWKLKNHQWTSWNSSNCKLHNNMRLYKHFLSG